jgi:selenocysteine lyase/cysteine desulfurase
VPLEQTAFGRRDVKAENPIYFADTRYLADARRFDMGERDHFISMEMAAIGMEMMASWGAGAVVARLSALTRRMSCGLTNSNALRPDDRFRAPHILCLRFPNCALGEVIAKLAHAQIYVAPRLGRMRISPHVYNDESDVDRFVTTVTRATA